MKDPYLVPGVQCEIYEGGEEYRRLAYFIGYDRAGVFPMFCSFCNQDGDWFPVMSGEYRVLDTEWSPGRFPKWAVCSTVDCQGIIEYWDSEILRISETNDECVSHPDGYCEYDTLKKNWHEQEIAGGCCPDKSRYEGRAWENSKRMMPDWAKVVKDAV